MKPNPNVFPPIHTIAGVQENSWNLIVAGTVSASGKGTTGP